MKVIIQTLKAPWPEGARVGDVVSFEAETAPAWAAGKYTLAPEEAEADFQYEPKLAQPLEATGSTPNPAEVKIAAARSDANEQARLELNARVLAAEQALAVVKADLEASLGRESTLQEQLTAAEQALAAAKAEAEAKPETKTAKK